MTFGVDLLLRIDGDRFEAQILLRLGVLPRNPMFGELKLLYMSIDCLQTNKKRGKNTHAYFNLKPFLYINLLTVLDPPTFKGSP